MGLFAALPEVPYELFLDQLHKLIKRALDDKLPQDISPPIDTRGTVCWDARGDELPLDKPQHDANDVVLHRANVRLGVCPLVRQAPASQEPVHHVLPRDELRIPILRPVRNLYLPGPPRDEMIAQQLISLVGVAMPAVYEQVEGVHTIIFPFPGLTLAIIRRIDLTRCQGPFEDLQRRLVPRRGEGRERNATSIPEGLERQQGCHPLCAPSQGRDGLVNFLATMENLISRQKLLYSFPRSISTIEGIEKGPPSLRVSLPIWNDDAKACL